MNPHFTDGDSDVLTLCPDGSAGGSREGGLDVKRGRAGQKLCVHSDLGTLFRNLLATAFLPFSQKAVN